MDLKSNQIAAKLYFDKSPVITKEEAEHFLKALYAEHKTIQGNGTEMWKLYVLQSAIINVRRMVIENA